eukprot:2662772-Amphidinium_carterae.1
MFSNAMCSKLLDWYCVEGPLPIKKSVEWIQPEQCWPLNILSVAHQQIASDLLLVSYHMTETTVLATYIAIRVFFSMLMFVLQSINDWHCVTVRDSAALPLTFLSQWDITIQYCLQVRLIISVLDVEDDNCCQHDCVCQFLHFVYTVFKHISKEFSCRMLVTMGSFTLDALDYNPKKFPRVKESDCPNKSTQHTFRIWDTFGLCGNLDVWGFAKGWLALTSVRMTEAVSQLGEQEDSCGVLCLADLDQSFTVHRSGIATIKAGC